MQQAGQITAVRRALRKRERAARPPEPTQERAATSGRRRVETVVETLAALRNGGETLSEVAHDARNMVTALGLYCDLLEEPGVLSTPFMHYGHELRLVAAASRRLVERIVSIDAGKAGPAGLPGASLKTSGPRVNQLPHVPSGTASAADQRPAAAPAGSPIRRWDLLPAMPISNLAAELLANRNLLAALAGPAIAFTVDVEGGARPVRLTGEDLTRVLVNLVKNAAEAMPGGGRIAIGLREQPAAHGAVDCLELSLDDNGPGIPVGALESIFQSGYTTHEMSDVGSGNWPLDHRGLGLTISRSIVEAAGGRIAARNRPQGGARFTVELPVRKGSY